MLPRDAVLVKQGFRDGIEGPGADDLVTLRPQIRGEEARVPLRIHTPMGGNLRRHRTREPGVEDVPFTLETTGHAALALLVTRRCIDHGVDRQLIRIRDQRARIVALSIRVQCVPDGDRHAEISLPGNVPVQCQLLRPIAIAGVHEGRMPLHGVPHGEQRILAVQQTAEPLAGGEEFQRASPPFVELHRMLDGHGIPDQGRARASGAARFFREQFHDSLPGLADTLAGEFRVIAVGPLGIAALETLRAEFHLPHPAVVPDQDSRLQILFPPPLHVALVAEGADHQDSGALLRVCLLTGKDRNWRRKERGHGTLSEEVAVTCILWMGRDPHAGGEQLGSSGGDHEGFRAVFHSEFQMVEGSGKRPILRLRLGDGGAVIDVPHGGRKGREDGPLGVEVQEGALSTAAAVVIDGGVLLPPVDGKPHPGPKRLEGRFVLFGHPMTEFDEVPTRDERGRFLPTLRRRLLDLQALLVGERGIAAHVVEVLDAPLRG